MHMFLQLPVLCQTSCTQLGINPPSMARVWPAECRSTSAVRGLNFDGIDLPVMKYDSGFTRYDTTPATNSVDPIGALSPRPNFYLPKRHFSSSPDE